MNVWKLNPSDLYIFDGDDVVRGLMRQLGVTNLFARAKEFDALHAFVAFDNHPTHWIILHLWQGVPAYSPNHAVHQLVRHADPNGLLFEAAPKSSTSRAAMEERLISEALKMGAKTPFVFQQLPHGSAS
ncbi:MAG: hypothetical protein HZA32_16855 [Opitutae bacterium]|nr:hypothetical protein [Opitutae bacterium]